MEKVLDDYLIATIDGKKVKLKENECTPERDSFLPMWGTFWTFGEWLDEEWTKENLQTITDCGFRIYEQEDFGILIGIDGAGYDFYGAHWIPLYLARGLKWHDEEDEKCG